MKILVSGATGFIGRHLVPVLQARGHAIVVLSRNLSHAFQIYGNSCAYVNDETPIQPIDGVVHLAGERIDQYWTKSAKSRIYNSRIQTAKKIIDRVKDSNVQFFVSASAIGYYGSRGDTLLIEDSGFGEGFLSKVCRDWESVLLDRIDFKTRKVVLRMAPVLGSDGGMLPKMVRPFKLGLGGMIGKGNQWVSWIHIDDAIQMYVKLIEDPSFQGVFNGVSPEPMTNRDFTQALAKALGRHAYLKFPQALLRLLLGEMSTILTASERVWPERFLERGFGYRYGSLRLALEDLLSDGKSHESLPQKKIAG